MATLTSTGAVNLTSSTNWSPAQIPATGDDLIIAAHTLTLNASMTLNTITFNSSASRLAFVAGTYTVQATDGWYRSHGTFTSGNLSAAAIAAGMDYTLVGQWIGNWAASQFTYAFTMTGGSLTLQTVGANPALPLIQATDINAGFGIAAMTGGALTTIGLLDYSGNVSAGNYLVTLASATWTHNSVGINYGLTSANSMIVQASGASSFSWTGDYVSSHGPNGNVGIFTFSGTTTANITGNITVTGGPTGVFQPAIILISAASTATINITGKLASIGTLLTINNSNAATINWSGNFSLASNEQITCVVQSGGLLNLNDLVIANSSTITMLGVNFGSIVAAGTTLITNMTTAALAACGGTRALDGKVITLESTPPTLPETQDVAAGTSYGYSTSPQTGTGLILDPAVMAASISGLVEDVKDDTIAAVEAEVSKIPRSPTPIPAGQYRWQIIDGQGVNVIIGEVE